MLELGLECNPNVWDEPQIGGFLLSDGWEHASLRLCGWWKTWIYSVATTLLYFPLTIHHLAWGLSWHPTPILSCPSWTTPILTGLRCNTEFLAGLFMVGHGSLVHGYRDALWPWLGDRSSTWPDTSICNSEWCPKAEYGTSRKTTLYEPYNPLLQSCPILHKIAPQNWNGSHTSCAGTLTGFILRRWEPF